MNNLQPFSKIKKKDRIMHLTIPSFLSPQAHPTGRMLLQAVAMLRIRRLRYL